MRGVSVETMNVLTLPHNYKHMHHHQSTLEEIRCPKSKQRLLLAQFDFAMPDECLGAVQRYMLSVRYMVTRRALRWLATRRRQVVDAAIKSEPFTLSMRPIDPGFGVSGRYADAYARCSNYDRKNGRLVEPSIPENWLSATTFPFGYEDNTVEGRLRSGEDLRLRFFHFKAMTGMGYGIRATDVQVHELQGNEPSIDDPVVFEHSFLASDGYQCVLGEEEFGSQVVLGPLDVALVNPGATSVDDQHSAQCVFPPPTPSALMDHFEERNFAFTKGMSRLAGQVHAYRLDVPANVFSANRDRIGNDSAAPLYYISIHNHISEPDGNDPVSRYLTRPVVKAHNWRKAQHVTTGFFRVGWGF